MELVNLLVIFAVIIVVMLLRRPLWLAVTLATAATILLYGLPVKEAGGAIVRGATGWDTIELLLVFYSITYLQRMLEKRRNLSSCQTALNGLFNNRRINASVVPFLLGCLPAASAVLICGPIVRESVGDCLGASEKAAVTSYFRHISESFLPTYATIFLAIEITGGRVTAGEFLGFMSPVVLALFLVGWAVYLRKIPKDTGMVSDRPHGYYWKLLFQSIWTILLAIALILLFPIPVEGAVWLCILLNVFVNRFSVAELIPFFQSALDLRLMLNTWLVMIFKEVLAATGVITELPAFFGGLPIPAYLVFALIFFFGTVVAGSQAIIALCMPMVVAAAGDGPVLALFILMMCMNYIAMQVSPTHICLTMCSEDYRISLGSLIWRTLPMVIIMLFFSFAYYALLALAGL